MTRRFRAPLHAAALALALALALPAHAQDTPVELPPVDDQTQLLYRQALQSIAEGRKQDAREALEQVVSREALHAGAWLDLALIHCGLGNKSEADRMFDYIERHFAPPPAILELINEARASRCDSWQPLSQFSLLAGRGSSSNVNQGTSATGTITGLQIDLPVSDEFRPMHDQYSTLTADYWRELGSDGMIGNLQLQGRRYDRLHDYDSASLFGGIDKPWRLRGWTLRGSAMVGLISLGNQLYQTQQQLQLRVEPPLPLPTGVKFSIGGAVSRIDYRTLSNFDSITGELRTNLSYRDRDNYVAANLSRMDDHARGDRPGGNRSGWLLNTNWRRNLPYNLTGELAYSRQNWRGNQFYTPGFINAVREQVTHVWRGSLTYPLSPRQALVLDARVVHNNENIALFQYTDRQAQLSWQWQW